MELIKSHTHSNSFYLTEMLITFSLIVFTYAMCQNYYIISAIILVVPFIFLIGILSFQKPIVLFLILFSINYFIMGIIKYVPFSGVNFIIDALYVFFLIILISRIIFRGSSVNFKEYITPLTVGSLIWMLYCCAELANPSAMLITWAITRELVYGALVISILATFSFEKYRYVKLFVLIYAIFTSIAIIKLLIQKFIGFDSFEREWLISSNAARTHLLTSTTRYFSVFTDAGNFGSNMGCSAIVFLIISLYIQKKSLKIFYSIVSIFSFYAMMLSGTRGAMIVPMVGLLVYAISSKRTKAIALSVLMFAFIYIFFAFTNIGQGNSVIRRMRTAFHPTADASYLVRKNDRKLYAEYLKNKPFGEGLGLSGGTNKKYTTRFTTSIPTDSWYVKIWAETGIIGLIVYLGFLSIVSLACFRIIIFKVTNPELKGILSGMLSGVLGLLVSAYGNEFWGQYPTTIIGFSFFAIILKGESFNKQIVNNLPSYV